MNRETAARLSVVVPVLNEAPRLAGALQALAPWRARGVEVVVVDGRSSDGTAACAEGRCDLVLVSEPGRARQMNAGAAAASGDLLLFLHIDTGAGAECLEALLSLDACEAELWGRFDVRLDGPRPIYRVIETGMNLRSAVTGIATGDQAIFVSRRSFERCGGYPDMPLMEDLALSHKLRRRARPVRLRQRVTASVRRWERVGIARTIALMWALRAGYWLGVSPAWLRRWYVDVRD